MGREPIFCRAGVEGACAGGGFSSGFFFLSVRWIRAVSLWVALSTVPIPQKAIRSYENWVRLLEKEVMLGQWLVLPGMSSSLWPPAAAVLPEKP